MNMRIYSLVESSLSKIFVYECRILKDFNQEREVCRKFIHTRRSSDVNDL